ncbi:MAG: VCBS repeat-containing protein [Solirubrobacterales bacterium]
MSGGLTSGRWGLVAPLAVVAVIAFSPARAGAVSFFRGDFPVGTHPTSVAVGNFNGGAPDLAVANEGSDNVSILLGDGFGQFTAGTPVSVGSLPSSVVVGRFNADSFDDLAVASVGNDDIAIRLGDGSGGFSGTGTVSTGTNSDPRAIATGDFNDDGQMDLISANPGSDTVSILLGDGLGGFAADGSPFNAGANGATDPIAVAAIQLGGTTMTPDNNLDAMIASQTSDQVLSLMNDGNGEITGWGTNYIPATSATNPNPSAIAVGSLNPNSPDPGFAAEPDILIANQGPDQIWPAFGRTDGQAFDFGGVQATGADPVAVAFGDLDGDGDPDGISANQGGGTVTVILSNGNGGLDVDTSPTVGSSPRAVATGNFDADGNADAAVANYDSNSATVLSSLQPGPPAVTPPVVTPPAVTAPTSSPPPAKKKKCKKKKKHRAATAKKKCKKKKKKKRR